MSELEDEIERLTKERDESIQVCQKAGVGPYRADYFLGGLTETGKLRQERDAALKACAEMRNILESVADLAPDFLDNEEGHFSRWCNHALSDQCGKDYEHKSKLEAADKACAELREAVEMLWAHCDVAAFGGGKPQWLIRALSNDCGKDYVSRDEVKPLLTAILEVLEHNKALLDIDGRPLDMNDKRIIEDAEQALAHWRKEEK